MDLSKKIRKKGFLQNNSGFSLIETIFVLMIISILAVIAIPKLEVPVRTSLKTIKNYSEIGLNSLKNSGFLAKEFRFLQVKRSIRSYLFVAKKLFMSESYLPSTAADLNRFMPVVGCYLPVKQNLSNTLKECKPLSHKLKVSSWESENRLFKINMIISESQLNILAIPYISDDKGVVGCYNSESGIIQVKTIKGKNLKKRFYNC